MRGSGYPMCLTWGWCWALIQGDNVVTGSEPDLFTIVSMSSCLIRATHVCARPAPPEMCRACDVPRCGQLSSLTGGAGTHDITLKHEPSPLLLG
jgi:hypothetical protein